MNSELRWWLLLLTVTTCAVLVCVYLVDRPAAEFFNLHLRQTSFWQLLDDVLESLVLAIAAALFFLLAAGCRLLSGNPLPTWSLKPLLCSFAALWALSAATIFKAICGRAWPDPTYIQNHLYGFHWWHGSQHWSSFPSGTACIVTSIAMVSWLVFPKLRAVSVALTLALIGGVVITNGHWISDVIAGAFLGGSIGWITLRLPYAGLARALGNPDFR